MKIQRVMCPVDGSKLSEQALPLAEALARRWGAELLLVRVVEPYRPPPDMIPELAERIAAWSREAPQASLTALAQALEVPSRTLVREGDPRVELAEAARDEEVSLIVMAPGRHSAGGRLLMGSTAETTLRLAPCPVLLAPDSCREPEFHRLLVPYDGSESSLKAVPAAQLLAAPGAHVTLLRATGADLLPLPRQEREAMLAELQEEFALLELPGLQITRHVSDAAPAPAILDRAELERSDLIVMTSHGRTGASRWLLGSVAEQVARHATCPVLVVPCDGENARRRAARAMQAWQA